MELPTTPMFAYTKMSSAEPSPDAKQAFFLELSRLGDDSSGSEGCNESHVAAEDHRRWREALYQRKKSSGLPQAAPPAHSPSNSGVAGQTQPSQIQTRPLQELPPTISRLPRQPPAVPNPRRTASSPAAVTSLPTTPLSDPIDSPSIPSPRRAPLEPIILKRSATMPQPVAKPSLKKRKKECPPLKVPQILQGLRLFLIRDDAYKLRMVRLAIAEQWGAERTWSLDDATHVIIDNDLDWDDVKPILAPCRTLDHLTIVNADFIPECIQYRTLLDPKQKHYQVKGYTEPASTGRPSSASSSGTYEDPLPIKPAQRDARKWDSVPASDTPPESQASPDTRGAAVQKPAHDEGLADQEKGQAEVMAPLSTEPYNDALSDCIAEALQAKDLPLDEDLDMNASDERSEGSDQDSDLEMGSGEETRAKKLKTSGARRKVISFDDRFACYRGGTLDSEGDNPNSRVIEVLQRMADHYERVNDNNFRLNSYRRAITTLKRQSKKITTFAEAKALANFGDRLAQKVEEIVLTDRLRQLEYLQNDPMNESLKTFLGIYGVGVAQASRWYAQGYRTLDDVKQNARLSVNQQIGIDHYDDLNTRIPRHEVEALGDFVKAAAGNINEGLELIVGGSYRRGAPDSGDIDFIVTKKGTTEAEQLLSPLMQLTSSLESEGFLVARLASSMSGKGSKWQGCCVLPKPPGVDSKAYRPIWRRIDFLAVPESKLGAALIYFTGNTIFNRSMRLLASKRQMRLNQRGLYKCCLRGPAREKTTEGELVESRDEKKIFEILGVRWREPHERWC